MPNLKRLRRQPPVRVILGQRMRFDPLVDQNVAAKAALSGRTFEREVCSIIRQVLGN